METKIIGKAIQTGRGYFIVDPDDRNVAREMLLTGDYSPDELELLLSYIRPDYKVLVVGAHIGAFAVPMARACRTLIALEANPFTYKLLDLNIKLNGLTNVKIGRFAAYHESNGEVEFLCNTHNTGGSKIRPLHMDAAYVYDSPALIKVPTVRIDDLGGPIDFIHMDIEGGERNALRGAQKTLSQCRALSVEFIPHHLTRVAGITLQEWLDPIAPHFTHMLVPRLRALVEREDWTEMLQNMMDAGAEEPAVIFTKG